MAKTIRDMAKTFLKEKGYLLTAENGVHMAEVEAINMFEEGAKKMLEVMETYIQNLDLGNSAEEKFYELDVIADIGLFIKQLNGEQL